MRLKRTNSIKKIGFFVKLQLKKTEIFYCQKTFSFFPENRREML